MSAIDNPAAFPGQPSFGAPDGALTIFAQQGMTLRDYFAAKAMQSLIARSPASGFMLCAISSMAYEAADAMLKERQA